MRTSSPQSSQLTRHVRTTCGWLTALALLLPAAAHAQYGAPELSTTAVGEKYHVEVSGALWNPDVFGVISSEQFGQLGTKIDFQQDLAYTKRRFKDLKIVLRPSRKSKFRIQHTPVRYDAETVLKRDITFNGQKFPLALPINSEFNWNVWRLGYEYDFLYKSRGYVGLILEGRYTEMTAALNSPLTKEFTSTKAPLPALGVTGRAYVLPEVAINFEVTGFKLPDIDPKYKANYFDWDINGTINVSNYVGLQVGWRRMSTFLDVKNDTGDVKFQGLWFGAALRY